MDIRHNRPHLFYFLLVVFALLFAAEAKAQFLSPIDTLAPMRDGKELAVDIYLPDGPGPWPVILIKTPYNRLLYRFNNLPLGIDGEIATSDYAIVTADWRCFYGSAGACITGPNRGEDGYDLVEWIATQSWCDGMIGMHSASALGNIQFMTAREKPPHLVCINPEVYNPTTAYTNYYEGGVAREEFIDFGDVLGFGFSTVAYTNSFDGLIWTIAKNLTYFPDEIDIPVFSTAGWYDHNVTENFEWHEGLRTMSDPAVRDQHKLLIGPWSHGKVNESDQGDISYPLAAGWSDSLSLLFFDYYLRGISNGWDARASYTWYEMGQASWNSADSWPPAAHVDQEWFLWSDQSIEQAEESTESSFSYNYDPRDPSPTIGGRTLDISLLQGVYDQAADVESRDDVLVFSTPVLGSRLEISGNPVVRLYVSTDQPDTDFMIRLTDVQPDGSSLLLAEGARRLRFRDGYTIMDTASAVAGQVYPLDISLPPLSYNFKPGHRMRLVISSSNWPRYNRNRNDGGEMYVSGDTLVAANNVHVGGLSPSSISFKGPDYISKIPVYPLQESLGELLIAYPNPTYGKSTLQWQGEREQVELVLYAADGKRLALIHNGWLTEGQQFQLDLSGYPAGRYYLGDNRKAHRSHLLLQVF